MNFKEMVDQYLNESNETINAKIKARKTREEDFKKEFDSNIKIKATAETGRKLPDDERALFKDDPAFVLRSLSKKVRYGKKEEDSAGATRARDDAEFFADVLEKAKKIPKLRVSISLNRINPSGNRDTFIEAYIKANKKWELGDEGERMMQLKKLYFELKKELKKL